jgi:rhodanese-related sulfurtransferase
MKQTLLSLLLAVTVASCEETAATGYENLDNKTFITRMQEPGIVLLDVRTEDEYVRGHIPNAINMDFYNPNFKTDIKKLDKDKSYLIYCAAGGRSKKTSRLLKDNGFNKVHNLQQGFNNWDGPVEK